MRHRTLEVADTETSRSRATQARTTRSARRGSQTIEGPRQNPASGRDAQGISAVGLMEARRCGRCSDYTSLLRRRLRRRAGPHRRNQRWMVVVGVQDADSDVWQPRPAKSKAIQTPPRTATPGRFLGISPYRPLKQTPAQGKYTVPCTLSSV